MGTIRRKFGLVDPKMARCRNYILIFSVIILASPFCTSKNCHSALPKNFISDGGIDLTLRGYFNGLDDILLRDDWIWIHHKTYGEPQYLTVNGFDWEPSFPNGGYNVDSYSNPLIGHTSVPPTKIFCDIDITEKPDSGTVKISQNPASENNFTLIITLDDRPTSGGYYYEFKVTSAQYTDHNPIWIDGNSDFISQAATENWPGNGSASNPFIIEGLNIVGLESEIAIGGRGVTINYPSQRPSFLITIRNVDLHFQIRSNRLVGANQTSIWLRNVENVVIRENDVSLNNRHGIAISYSKNCLVFNNTLFSNEEAGVGLWESSNCTISHNVVYNNTWSVYAENTSTIINCNTIYDSDSFGIDLYESKECLVSNNVVYDTWYSVFLWVSLNNKISDNIIYDNYYGIELENASNNNIITNNSINGNDEYGVYISSSENTTVNGNDFTNNNPGGASQAYDDNNSNLFVNNYWSDHTTPDNDGNGIVDEPYSIAGSANNEDIHPKVSAYNPDLIHVVSSSTSELLTTTTSRSSQSYSPSYVDIFAIFFIVTIFFLFVSPFILFIALIIVKSRRSRIYDRYPVIEPVSTQQPTVEKIETTRRAEITSSDISEEPVKPAQIIPTIKPLPKLDITETIKPIADVESPSEVIPTVPTPEVVGEDKRSLFSSIQYRVQDLFFEKKEKTIIACLIPYSGSIKEIRVEFDKTRIAMKACMKGEKITAPNLEIIVSGEPKRPSWENPWQNIELIGENEFIERIKSRGTMADNFVSLGTSTVKIESAKEGEIHLCITCDESKEAIERAYSLIKELQSFLELSQY